MISEISQQYPLALKLDRSVTFANFWADADQQVLQALQPLATQAHPNWVYLAGPQGSGVSHLLQACTAAATDAGFNALYLNLAELVLASQSEHQHDEGGQNNSQELSAYLEGLEEFELLCLDDIDAIADLPHWQEAVFYLLEKLKNRWQSRLLIGAHCAAANLSLSLADLQSRLKWATGYQLAALDDDQKVALLQFKAEGLGLAMSEDVARFLLARCSRRITDLVQLLDELDRLALSSGRALTIPWIKSVLDL